MKVLCSWSTLMLERGYQISRATECDTFSLTKLCGSRLVNP